MYKIKYFNLFWEEISIKESLKTEHYVSIGNKLNSLYRVVDGKINKTLHKLSHCKEVHIPTLDRAPRALWWGDKSIDLQDLSTPTFGQKIIEL